MRQKNNTRPGSQGKECHRIYNTLRNKRYDSSVGKESACYAGDTNAGGSIPGSGRSAGEGKSDPLQYSGLENSMDCTVYGVTKSRTQLSDFHFSYLDLASKF